MNEEGVRPSRGKKEEEAVQGTVRMLLVGMCLSSGLCELVGCGNWGDGVGRGRDRTGETGKWQIVAGQVLRYYADRAPGEVDAREYKKE